MSGDGFAGIAAQAERSGIVVPPPARAALCRYVALLEHWNRRINLVRVRDGREIWQRHVLDCLMLETVPAPADAARWLDLGTGAGLPGVVLALLHPGRSVTAVDTVAKKITFLGEVVRALDLPNLHPLRADAATLAEAPDFAPYDAVVCRAFRPLPQLLPLAAPLLRPGGRLWAMKGRQWEHEAARVSPSALAAFDATPHVTSYRLGTGGDGTIVVYRRRVAAVTQA